MNSGVKPQKKGIFFKICEKTILAHKFWGDNQYFGVSGLELQCSGTKPVTFFRAQSTLVGAQFLFGGPQAVIWGHGAGMFPVAPSLGKR